MADNTIDDSTNKKQQNSAYKTIKNIGFTIFMIIMAFLIFISAQSKLMGQEPSLFGYRMYIVDSGSMIPTLPINSMIIIDESGVNGIAEGDIITYYAGTGNTRVTHRVVEVLENEEGYITKGDANNTEDPTILKKDRIIGELAFSIPYLGLLFRGLSSRIGIAILVGLVALFTIIPAIFKKIK